MSAAMGDGPAPVGPPTPPAPVTGGEPAARPNGELADPFVSGVLFP